MPRNRINGILLIVIAINTCALIGCHRSYYRRQADMEASRLIRQKATDPRWNTADGKIDIDPQSRMFNPFSQDHPPIPPDDATSHQFMHVVDQKEGYPHWHANGDTNHIENPVWMSYLPINEKGQVVLTLDRAYQLALIHSPDLQEQRETLYLSALDVSLERFGFDSQLFTGFNSFLTTQGRLRNGGNSSTTLSNQIGSNGGGLNIERLGITGANFAVGLANTVLFNFSGNNTQSATSLIDFSLIQPLLRGAGRERILESLTQSERTLLANVRQLERFRRGFYLQIATGRNPGTGTNRGGNFLGNPGSANFNAGGFFGLLEAQQRIRNQEFNVRQLEAVLEQFREFFTRDRLDSVQLKQFEANVYRQQRNLLDQKTNYQASLDDFKLLLGLPPTIDIVIEDPFLDRFELISDQINERMISISNLRKTTGSGLNDIYQIFEGVGTVTKWPDFKWPSDLNQRIQKLNPFIESAEATLEKIVNQDRKLIETDLRKLEDTRADRVAYLKKVKRAINAGKIISSVDPELFEAKSIVDPATLRKSLIDPEMDSRETIIDEDGEEVLAPRSILKRAEVLQKELQEAKQRIADFAEAEASISKKAEVIEGTEKNPVYEDPALYDYIVTEFQEKIPGQLSELNNLALELSLLQALARSNTIEINDVNIDSEHAIRIARCMRRDLMNARANLVDQWRNIEFVADQLEAGVDIVFEGEIGNVGDNPFKLRLDNGQLRGGFRFDAPIVRMAERNQYRQALIQYQQARRNFYQFEDNLNANLRDILRNIDRSKVLFELDRLTVQVDIQNVEINRYQLDAPVSVNAAGGGTNRLGAQTSRNLTDAIINLNGSQNSFLQTWVRFEVLRRNLDFDMGTMQIDQNGSWIDPGYIDGGIVTRAANMMGLQLDCQFCENVEVFYSDDGYSQMSDGVYSDNVYGEPVYGEPSPVGGFGNQTIDQAPSGNGAIATENVDLETPEIPDTPELNRGDRSGSRSNSYFEPLSFSKPAQPPLEKTTSASKPDHVASVELTEAETEENNLAQLKEMAEELAQKIAQVKKVPVQTKFAAAKALEQGPPDPSLDPQQELFKSPTDDPFAVEKSVVVAKSAGYATQNKSAANQSAVALINSSFENSSAMSRPISTIEMPRVASAPLPQSELDSIEIPTAKLVLAVAEAKKKLLDSKPPESHLQPGLLRTSLQQSNWRPEALSSVRPKAASDSDQDNTQADRPRIDHPIVIRAIPESSNSSGSTRSSNGGPVASEHATIGETNTEWKNNQSSLGGLLNRFRTGDLQHTR